MFENPVRVLSQSQVKEMKLKFYNTDIHRASFALPQFVKDVSHINAHTATCASDNTVCDVSMYVCFRCSNLPCDAEIMNIFKRNIM